MPTFREAAAATFETLRPRWRSDKVAANWMQQLERHAMRRLGPLPVDTIGREDVLRVLTPIWTATPETARRVRRCIKATLRWAVSSGHAEVNMAGEVLDGALPRLPSVKAHLRALPYSDVPQALDTIGDATIGALALRFRDSYRRPIGRGEGGDVGRGRHRRGNVDDPRRAHESRPRASRTADPVRCSTC